MQETLAKWGPEGMAFLDVSGEKAEISAASSFLHSNEQPKSLAMQKFILRSAESQLRGDAQLLKGARRVHEILFPSA